MRSLKAEIESPKHNKEQDDSEGIFSLFNHNQLCNFDAIGNWFERTEFECGAVNLPRTSEELYEVTKVRHLNFLESIIQANM